MITNVLQDGSQAKTLMWQKIGSQADEWKPGLVTLYPSQSSYQVRNNVYQGNHSPRTQTSFWLSSLFLVQLSNGTKYICVRRLVLSFALV